MDPGRTGGVIDLMEDFSLLGGQLLLRVVHLLAAIVWLGLGYYFNFVHAAYFREAVPDARADLIRKLIPLGMSWSRVAALFTIASGALLVLVSERPLGGWSLDLAVGALLGVLMFLNVWFVIWPNYRVTCGLEVGDAAVAGPRAQLAARINVLFSLPLLVFMTASAHLPGAGLGNAGIMRIALIVAIVGAIETNAVAGRAWSPLLGTRGLVGSSIAFALLLWVIVHGL